jgi:hypothetical protein
MILGFHLLPERKCNECTDRKKVAWGCTAAPKEKLTFDGEVMDRCPLRPALDHTNAVNDLLWYYSNFNKKGVLPEPGGLLDQPAVMLEVFRVFDGAVATVDSYERAKREAEAAKARNRPRRGRR